jgi:hypothetical protein
MMPHGQINMHRDPEKIRGRRQAWDAEAGGDVGLRSEEYRKQEPGAVRRRVLHYLRLRVDYSPSACATLMRPRP